MYSEEKLLELLKSGKLSLRREACEILLVSKDSSPDIVRALQNATLDLDKGLAGTARMALKADVHHQMFTEMVTAELHMSETESIQVGSTPIEEIRSNELVDDILPIDKQVPFVLLAILQLITFVISVLSFFFLIFTSTDIFSLGLVGFILIGIYLIYIGLQVYVIMKYGFRNSFYFLRFLIEILTRH